MRPTSSKGEIGKLTIYISFEKEPKVLIKGIDYYQKNKEELISIITPKEVCSLHKNWKFIIFN